MPVRNFGIVKHPGVGSSTTATPKLPSFSPEDSHSSHEHETTSESGKTRRPSSTRNDSSTAQELLKSKGFIPITWHGKCEADKVSLGTYAVLPGSRKQHQRRRRLSFLHILPIHRLIQHIIFFTERLELCRAQ
jgi:hypothetical protein